MKNDFTMQKQLLTNVSHQPNAFHSPLPVHRLHPARSNHPPDISQRHIPHPARKHKNGSSEIAHHLPDRLFVSLAREVANEDRAVGVAERVVCSERELEMNGETNDEARRRNRTGREAHGQRPAWEQIRARRMALSWGATSVPSMLPTWIGWYLSA
jgi:hypothetical protein